MNGHVALDLLGNIYPISPISLTPTELAMSFDACRTCAEEGAVAAATEQHLHEAPSLEERLAAAEAGAPTVHVSAKEAHGHVAPIVGPEMRQRAVQRLAAALLANKGFSGDPHMAASEAEGQLFEHASHR